MNASDPCLRQLCGHPAYVHWPAGEPSPGPCRVTGCPCQQFTQQPVEDAREATAITLSIQPGQRARITIEVEALDADSGRPVQEQSG